MTVSLLSHLAIFPIHLYQRFISPLLPPCCRFTPTCSNYAIEAFLRHGFLRGMALTLWRLLRCAPWSAGGYDPVPPVTYPHPYQEQPDHHDGR